jgi:riboflavin kinase/FMN adenylyltransferase
MQVQVIDSLDTPVLRERAVVTIGNFDGFHLGHQALVGAVVQEAQARECHGALVTFDPHPQEVLNPDRRVPRICTPELRRRGFQRSGLDVVHVLPFTAELAELSAEDFATRFLVERFQLEKLVIGYDFRFGKHRAGDFKLLENLSQQQGFELEEIPPVQVDHQTVSSTLIRQLLSEYRFSDIPTYLGRPHSLLGPVVSGDRRGREIGFPTANLMPQVPLALPHGVYATRVKALGQVHHGVTNVGIRPTFGKSTPSVETWIFDFEGDLYGEALEVWPVHHIRPEQRFPSIEALIRQIQLDAEQARNLLATSEILPKMFPED